MIRDHYPRQRLRNRQRHSYHRHSYHGQGLLGASRSVNPRRPRRSQLRLMAIATLFLTMLASAASASEPSIVMSDGQGLIEALEVGDDLWLGAQNLTASIAVDVVLRDSVTDDELLRRGRMTDAQGFLSLARLWSRTGLGGCDCGDYGTGYAFEWPYEAQMLVGRQLRLSVEARATSTVLATALVPVVERSTPWLYPSSVLGCAQQLFAPTESIFLNSDQPIPRRSRVFVVAHRGRLQIGDVLQDARPNYPQGQQLPAAPQRLSELIVSAGELGQGEWILVWRPDHHQGRRLLKSDTVITLPAFMYDDLDYPSDGGLVIDDWTCGSESGPVLP